MVLRKTLRKIHKLKTKFKGQKLITALPFQVLKNNARLEISKGYFKATRQYVIYSPTTQPDDLN